MTTAVGGWRREIGKGGADMTPCTALQYAGSVASLYKCGEHLLRSGVTFVSFFCCYVFGIFGIFGNGINLPPSVHLEQENTGVEYS